MTRTGAVKSRQLQLAREAGRRWDATMAARGQVQTEIARKGPLLAETPARAQRFQQRESMRATIQTVEARRGLLPGQERVIGLTFDLHDLPSNQDAERAGHPVARLIDPPQPGIVPQ